MDDPVDTADPVGEFESALRRRRRRFWLIVLLTPVAILFVALLLAPRIASLPVVRSRALAAINEEIKPQRLGVDDWRLRWVGGMHAANVSFEDPVARRTGRVQGVSCSRGLLGLLPVGRLNLGTIRLLKPEAQVVLPGTAVDGRAATVGETPPGEPVGAPTPREPVRPAAADGRKAPFLPITDLAATIEIEGGAASVVTPTGDAVAIEAVNGRLELTSKDTPMTVKLDLRLVAPRGPGGSVHVEGALDRPLDLVDGRQPTGRIELRTEQLEMAAFNPFLRPLLGGGRVTAGRLDGTAGALITGPGRVAAEAELTLQGLLLAHLGEESASMPPAMLRLAGRGQLSDGVITLEDAALRSPWAVATAEGTFDAGRQSGGVPTGKLSANLRIELPEAARDFGRMLHLSPGLEVVSGRLLASVVADATDRGVHGSARMATTNLLLRSNGSSLTFQPPPSLDLQVWRPHGQLPEVESFLLAAPFAQLSGAGRYDSGRVEGFVDLTQLARTLRPLLTSLPPMVGRVDLKGQVARQGNEAVAELRLGLTDLAVSFGRPQPLVIEQGAFDAKAAMPLAEGKPAGSVNRLACSFTGSPGSAEVAADGLTWPSAAVPEWVVTGGRGKFELDLEAVLRMLRPWAALPTGATAAGRWIGGWTCEAASGEARVRWNSALRGLRVVTTGWDIREPDARMEGTVTLGRRRLSLAQTSGRSSVCTVDIPELRVDLAGAGGAVTNVGGSVSVRSDLAALDAWRRVPAKGGKTTLAGKVAVDARADAIAEGTRVEGRGVVNGLAVIPPYGEGWRDPRAELAWSAVLSPAGDRLSLNRLNVSNALVTLQSAGALTDLPRTRRLSLDGRLAVNMATVEQLLAGAGITGLKLQGNSARPFDVAAPMAAGAPAVLSYGSGRASCHIAALEGMGLSFGPADASLRLKDGQLNVAYAPPLNDGVMRLEAAVSVGEQPFVLTLPAELPVLRDVKLTDAMMRSMLGMVNPLLSQCRVISGRISTTISGGRAPLASSYVRETEFDGRIELKDVVIMPSGVLAEVLGRVGVGDKALELENEVVNVQCRKGRIRPSPHTATVSGHPVVFTGSVGLDESVAYRIEVPLTQDLVGAEAWKYIGGKTVGVPVSGTVKRPAVDTAALAGEVRNLVAEAARRAMAERAGDLLQRLRKRVEEP